LELATLQRRRSKIPTLQRRRSRPLPDQEPPPLVLVQIKLFDDHSLSSLAIGRLDRSEIFAAAAHDDDRLAGIWDWYVGPRRSD